MNNVEEALRDVALMLAEVADNQAQLVRHVVSPLPDFRHSDVARMLEEAARIEHIAQSLRMMCGRSE